MIWALNECGEEKFSQGRNFKQYFQLSTLTRSMSIYLFLIVTNGVIRWSELGLNSRKPTHREFLGESSSDRPLRMGIDYENKDVPCE